MGLNATKYKQGGTGGDLGQAKPGGHIASLVGIIDVGVQDGGSWQGKPKPPCGQVLFVCELSDDTVVIDDVEQNRVFTIKALAKSGDKAKMTKILSVIDPTGAHASNLATALGSSFILNLKEEPRQDGQPGTVVKFDSMMPLLPGMPTPVIQTPLFAFDQDNPDMGVFMNSLHPWMRETVKAGLQYKGSQLEQMVIQAEAEAQASQAPVAQPPVVNQVVQPQVTQAATVQAQAPGVPTLPSAPAPTQAPVATVPTLPAAPPGFEYDPATNSFKQVGE